jgi:hypothetical protein
MRYLLSYHLYKTLKNPTFVKKGTFFIFFKLGLSWVFCIWFWTYFRGSLSDYQRTLRGHFVWFSESQRASDNQRTHLIFRGLIWFSEDSSDFQRLTLIFRGSLWFSERGTPPKGPTFSLDWVIFLRHWKICPLILDTFQTESVQFWEREHFFSDWVSEHEWSSEDPIQWKESRGRPYKNQRTHSCLRGDTFPSTSTYWRSVPLKIRQAPTEKWIAPTEKRHPRHRWSL